MSSGQGGPAMEQSGNNRTNEEAERTLRLIRKDLVKLEFFRIQAYWSRRAREKGISTEADLERHLSR